MQPLTLLQIEDIKKRALQQLKQDNCPTGRPKKRPKRQQVLPDPISFISPIRACTLLTGLAGIPLLSDKANVT